MIKRDVNLNKWEEIHLSGVENQGDMAGNIIQQLLASQTSYGQIQTNFRLTNTHIYVCVVNVIIFCVLNQLLSMILKVLV